MQTDILIIGGGLAGLTAALHLHKAGLTVILIEKNAYPHHKVCGEYISNEVLPYLQWLGADVKTQQPTNLNKLQFTTLSGKSITTKLPLGGFGISRYCLDNFLFRKLVANGVTVLQDTVTAVTFTNNSFNVSTQAGKQITAKQVIGAYGKRAVIDIKLNRKFIKEKSAFLAVKAHYSGVFDENLVALHHFNGGYCGVSKVENSKINICYLADYESFKKHKNIAAYQQNVLYKNPHLKHILENCTLLFEEPLSISQIAFGKKEAVQNHVLMVGDTAGLIHPLCGNGMAMAIHSAKICAELLIDFYSGKITARNELENNYISLWNKLFSARLKMGSVLSAILTQQKLTDVMFSTLVKMPYLLPYIIKKTHGKTLITNN